MLSQTQTGGHGVEMERRIGMKGVVLPVVVGHISDLLRWEEHALEYVSECIQAIRDNMRKGAHQTKICVRLLPNFSSISPYTNSEL